MVDPVHIDDINSVNEDATKERNELSPLYPNAQETSTLNFIIAFFTAFTVTITVVLWIQIYYKQPQVRPHGNVVSDSETCSYIGTAVISEGGSSVDAAIATTFCLGVVNPYLTGVGGFGWMVIYDQKRGKMVDSIDFRATRSNDSKIGVPGYVSGLALAHKLYGKLSWNRIVMPAVHVANAGFRVTEGLLKTQDQIDDDRSELKMWLKTLTLDLIVPVPQLAVTLSFIASNGADAFYNKTLMEDLPLDGKSIAAYSSVRGHSKHATYLGYDINVPGDGSGGPTLLDFISHLDSRSQDILSLVPVIGEYKEWPMFAGSHVAVENVDDIYVSIVTGLGSVWGSQRLTDSGYVLNNALEISQDKKSNRPMVLTAPIVITEKGHVCGRRLITGGGDVRIVAQVVFRLLSSNRSDIVASVEQARIALVKNGIVELENKHLPQLTDSEISYLEDVDKMHITSAPLPYQSINVIEKIADTVNIHEDSRSYRILYPSNKFSEG